MDDTTSAAPQVDDLSTLAWVHEELKRSLEAANKALRRFVRENEGKSAPDLDAIDPAVLRNARNQIHQGVGALELVGQPAAAMVLRASEAALQRFIAKPHKLTSAVVADMERASFALLDYLTRLLAGKPVSTLSLFPQYRAVQEASGAERVHPADLSALDWRWHELPAEEGVTARAPDSATRAAIEAQLLPLMRAPDPRPIAEKMSALTAELGSGAAQPQVATLWRLASAVFEAQSQGLLGFDVFSKRVASRLLAQFRTLERGDTAVSERLAQDLLFFCAQAQSPAEGQAPRLAAVRQAWGLAAQAPVDYNRSVLGRFDPAVLAQARKRVTAAKDAWSAVAGGEMHRLPGISEQFALVGESLKKLFPHGEVIAGGLQQAIAQTQQAQVVPPAPLAMEVATSLLYIEAALEDGDFEAPEQAGRVERLAERLAAVRAGRGPEPLESWMEDLYRRVSDRQTMGSVVQELRANLSEVEKQIDHYFRHPEERQVLVPVPAQLSAMRGVLSVLGMDHACSALLRMRDEVDRLATTEIDQHEAHVGVFDRLASNLGALGFLIDMLSVQPQMAKSLFSFNADTGVLSPVMGRSGEVHAPAPVDDGGLVLLPPTPMEELPATPLPAAVLPTSRGDEDLGAPMRLDFPPSTRSAPLEQDAEMREIFLEEAREVLESAVAARAELGGAPEDLSAMTTLRRAFHTLKGSSRMVGLKEFGEAAWACEQVYNTHLAGQRAAPPALLEFTSWSLGYLATWVDEISAQQRETHSAAAVVEAAKHAGETAAEPTLESAAVSAPAPTPVSPLPALSLPEGLPSAADLDFRAPGAPAHAGEPAHAASADEFALPELDALPQADAAAHAEPPSPDEAHAALDPIPSLDVFGDIEELVAVEPAAAPELPEGEGVDALAPVSFDIDLDDLDSMMAPLPGEAPAASAPVPLHAAASLPTEPMPLAEIVGEVPADEIEHIDLALDFGVPATAPAAATPTDEEAALAGDEQFKEVGPLRISLPLFNIYLNEAEDLSRRLSAELQSWSHDPHAPIGESPIALAHSLAGSSATVGYQELSQLARALEDAQTRSHEAGAGTPEEAQLFTETADEIRGLLHQFAAGFLKSPSAALMARLAAHEREAAAHHEPAEAHELEAVEAPATPAAELPSTPVDEPEAAREDAPESAEADAFATAPHSASASPVAPEALAASEDDEDDEDEATHHVEHGHPPVPPLAPPDSGFAPLLEPIAPAVVGTDLRPFTGVRPEAPRTSPADRGLVDADEAIDAVDAVDAELFPIFDEEALELLPALAGHLRDWARKPADTTSPAACMRALHTLKGGARLAGAMRLGEMAHRMETRIEQLLASPPAAGRDIEALQQQCDALESTLDALREEALASEPSSTAASTGGRPSGPAPAAAAHAELARLLDSAPMPLEPLRPVAAATPGVAPISLAAAPAPEAAPHEAAAPEAVVHAADASTVPTDPAPVAAAATETPASGAADAPTPEARAAGTPAAEIDWSRFAPGAARVEAKPRERQPATQSAVRVRAPLLDRLVNQAGEVSIARSRIETGVGQIKTSLGDLTENLERLRAQLRDLEFHGELQMNSRMEAAKAASADFDPLEFDRFTRFQELTRMMAESVNDVATVQRTLQRSLEVAEDELVAQARMTRDLQDDLLRTRMVEFEGLSERLYRVVRQAAKETGKSVRLDIVGGSIEVDRGVLDRMTGAFEHLLRNGVSHGIESPEARTKAGKDATGTIIVSLTQEANEVGVEFRDDGAGLDLPRIRAKAEALGLVAPGAPVSDMELAGLIFAPGFSTAEQVTEIAGRGVGMDVVRSEVNAMGGRIETATAPGQGTSFRLILPLTTAVTQVVMLRCGTTRIGVPSTLVEVVRRATADEIDTAYANASYIVAERPLQFYWLGALLQIGAKPTDTAARTRNIVVIRSAQQRVALHVDEVLGNQEVVVKHLGPQLSRLPGLAGITLLASGEVALIYNPVALAALYGEAARAATFAAFHAPASNTTIAAPLAMGSEPAAEVAAAPLVMVVDDSLTVRRVTQRLLQREGYRVVLAKDGLDALERLAEALPEIVLSDIEMPRMDGFDLVRNMRSDPRLRDMPVIMITSRIAQKHRDYAAELGVDHYLGKPYSEEDLLALIAKYTGHRAGPRLLDSSPVPLTQH